MSRAISTSVNLLRNSLNSCKTAIANKGVTVPSTTKVSGLPALINKIETEKRYTVTVHLNNDHFTVLGNSGTGKTYNYGMIHFLPLNDGESCYSDVFSIIDDKRIKVANVKPGYYMIGLNLSNSSNISQDNYEYENGICSVYVGDTTVYSTQASLVILIIPIHSGVTDVYLNGSSEKLKPISDNFVYYRCVGVEKAKFSFKKDGTIYQAGTISMSYGIYLLDYDTSKKTSITYKLDNFGNISKQSY